MYIRFFCALFTLICVSCTPKPSTIQKISIASAGCHGECPQFALEINDQLSIKYYGGSYAKTVGFYTGKISQKIWDELTEHLEKSNYLKMDSMYYQDNDYEDIEMIIQSSKSVKHIQGIITDIPTGLISIFKEISSIQEKIALKKSSDTLQFETTVQYPPKVTTPKFPMEGSVK